MQINKTNSTIFNINFGSKHLQNINKKFVMSNQINRDIFQSAIIKYDSILKQISEKGLKLPKEISSIVIGKLGKIRSSKELTVDDIIKLIKHETKPFEEAEIKKILSAYSSEEQALAKKLLIRCSQFAKLDSLKKIAENIDTTLYQDTLPSCGTTIRYLQKYGHLKGRFDDSSETGTIIIDKLVLERLENNPDFLKKILANPDFKFLLPEGYITGVNPFSQTQDLSKLLKDKIKLFNSLRKQYPEKTEDEIFSIILNQPILERLNKLGISSDRIRILQNIPRNTSYEIKDILNQFNSKNVTRTDIENILTKYNREEWPYILEILAQTLKIKSTRTCSESYKQIYKDIIQANGGTDEGIYYLLPVQAIKSYSTVIMQFFEANNLDASKIIQKDDLGKEAIKKARAIVILDDMACSGESLKIAFKDLAEQLCIHKSEVSDIIISPVMCSRTAFPLLNNTTYLGRNVTCIPGEIVENFSTNAHVRSLNPAQQKIYKELLQGGGYEGGDYSLAFPYMAPDNNNRLFATEFAKLFTLDGLGVK